VITRCSTKFRYAGAVDQAMSGTKRYSEPTALAAAALAPSIGSSAPGLSALRAASDPGAYSRNIELTAAASSVAQARASTCNESTSYINSSGNCIHRPETTGSAPSGATAQCTEGEYSLSQHHAGTCSGHGGVK
jgi:hypothetical protein